MSKMSDKQRLLATLNGNPVDRQPVICPGGMMNAAVTEVIESLQGNHNTDVKAMVKAAKLVHEKTGFENYGVPFCMTAEAEPLGIQVDFGSKQVEPRVTQYSDKPMEDWVNAPPVIPREEERMQNVLQAIKALKNDDVPVIGNITGHVSTASSIIDPNIVFKYLLKKPELSHAFFKYVNSYLIDYAKEMIREGADVIAISDPTATGEILGARMFKKFALPYYQEFVKAIEPFQVPIIFHMCGKATNVIEILDMAGFHALSFDSVVSMRNTKPLIHAKLMGNINTQALNFESEEKIEALTKHCLDVGVDIVSPACGLGMSTPIKNIRAMTEFVKKSAIRKKVES